MSKFSKYWFRANGEINLAIVRICVFSSLLYSVVEIPSLLKPLFLQNSLEYLPKGLWQIFSPTIAPSMRLVEAVFWTAIISSSFSIIGLFTRLSIIISVLTTLLLTTLVYCWQPYPSHYFNFQVLSALCFVGSQAGNALSIDSLRSSKASSNVYWWPILLGQIALGSMLLNAVSYKFVLGGFGTDVFGEIVSWDISNWRPFRWIFSDSLRNHLALTWWVREDSPMPPPLVKWIISHPHAWKAMAFGNFIGQSMPILSVFFSRNAWVRLLCGLVFLCEIAGLGVVVGFWNYAWFPLCAFFIDWEFFIAKIGFERKTRDLCAPSALSKKAIATFIFVYIGMLYLVGYVPRIRHMLKAYPFDNFPMFSHSTNGAFNYRLHEYLLSKTRDSIEPDTLLNEGAWDRFNALSSHLALLKAPSERDIDIQRRLENILSQCSNEVVRVDAFEVTWQIREYPYPEKPHPLKIVRVGTLER